MGDLEGHNLRDSWYRFCPELPFSFCGNLMITLLFILFLPLLAVVFPFISVTAIVFCEMTKNCLWKIRNCFCKVLVVMFMVFIYYPIALVLGVAIYCLWIPFLLPVLYFYSISFFVRLCVMACRTKI